MSNKTQGRAPTLTEGILALVREYGQAIDRSNKVATIQGRQRASLTAGELYMEIGAALRSGRLATPGLGAELNRRFGLNQDDHFADYGPNLGPSSPFDEDHRIKPPQGGPVAGDGCVPELHGAWWDIGGEGCPVRRSTGHLCAEFAVGDHNRPLARLRVDLADEAAAPALPHGLKATAVVDGRLILTCICGDPPFSGADHTAVHEAFAGHVEVENLAVLTPDSPDRPADLPPYVTVEVIEQGRDWTRLSVPSVDIGLTATCYVDNGSPPWLAEVPLGKHVVVRLAYEQIGRGPVRAFTDWVEPAADGCSPRWGNDQTEWVIGDNTCVLGQAYNETPADAVVRHNEWLASVLDHPTAGLGPVPAPAAPRPYNPRPHSIVAGFGGAFCEPCRTAPDDYRCEDLTCSRRCRAVDLAAVIYPDAAPAAPVAVSPERVEEILGALNEPNLRDPFHDVIGLLPELVDGSQCWLGDHIWGFDLADGTPFRRGTADSPWAVTR